MKNFWLAQLDCLPYVLIAALAAVVYVYIVG
jgi:hypothetical protein